MKRAKRFLGTLLALCLCLGLLPGAAFAADSSRPFTDVADAAWYSEAVQYVYEHGLMSGTGGGESGFGQPWAIAPFRGGCAVSDAEGGAVRQVKDGMVTTLARQDVNDLSSFIPVSPVGLAVRGGRLYVCDSYARKVFVISLA